MGWAGRWRHVLTSASRRLSARVERNRGFHLRVLRQRSLYEHGRQRSSATPWLAWTTTTPVAHPKDEPKKDIVAIMAAQPHSLRRLRRPSLIQRT